MARGRSSRTPACDVLIVGGGPAGLAAALLLGRCRRSTMLVDAGRPRNAWTRTMHGYPSRDGVAPGAFLRLIRRELARYPSVVVRRGTVRRVWRGPGGFIARLEDGSSIRSRRLLLATGVVDRLPRVPGFEQIYGRSAFHCPFCDAWEVRDRRLVVYGRGKRATGVALELLAWSARVAVVSDGPPRLAAADRRLLERHGIAVVAARVTRFRRRGGRLLAVEFAGRAPLPADALFFTLGQEQSCDLAVNLGCGLTRKGAVRTYRHEVSDIPGLYVAGDASARRQFVTVAVAEGAEAAAAMHESLARADRLKLERRR